MSFSCAYWTCAQEELKKKEQGHENTISDSCLRTALSHTANYPETKPNNQMRACVCVRVCMVCLNESLYVRVCYRVCICVCCLCE